MKIGMFTSGYQRNPLEHCFQDAKEYGYDYIELWGGRPIRLSTTHIRTTT